MKNHLEKRNLAPGDHLCFLYETEEEHRSVVTDFLRQGLAQNHKMIYVVDSETPEQILNHLEDGEVSATQARQEERLNVVFADEAFGRQNSFDYDDVMDVLKKETRQAQQEGYDVLRVTVEMSWLLRHVPDSDQLTNYEAELDEFFAESSTIVLCQYDRRLFPAQMLLNVLRTHPVFLGRSGRIENFYYIPPTEHQAADPAQAELQSWKKDLTEHAKAEEVSQKKKAAKCKEIFNNTNDAMYYFTLTDDGVPGLLMEVNPKACEMLGYSREEFLQMTVQEIQTAEKQKYVPTIMSDLFKDGCLIFETEHVAKDGSRVPVEISTHLFTAEGEQRVLSIARDVSERKQAEERERAVLRRLQAFEAGINQGPAVVFRWRIEDDQWPVEIVSDNVRQFGYEADELTSGRVSWPGITHPDDVPRLQQEVQKHLAEGVEKFHQHYRLMTRSGEIRQVEDWNAVIKDAEGEPTHIQAVVLDVTHYREEEQRRRESEKGYRRLFESMMDAILTFDPALDKVTSVNPACVEMMRCTDEMQLIGFPPWTFSPERQPDGELSSEKGNAYIATALDKGSNFFEWIHKRADGAEFPATVLLTRFDIEGRPFVQATIRDITERKRAEEALAESEHRFQKMLAAIPDMVSLQDPDMNILYSNWKGVGAVPEEKQVLNTKCYRTYRGFDDICPDCRAKTVLQTKETLHEDVELVDGTWRTVSAVPVLDNNNEVEFFVEWVADITERKKREQLIVNQRERLRQLAARLANVQDEEQRRISQGLHDDVAQLLSAVSTRIALARGCNDADRLVDIHEEVDQLVMEANEKVRTLSFDLVSSTLGELGLAKAIEELCRNMKERHGMHFQIKGTGYTEKIDERSATVLFKAVRELMFNVVKHAGVREGTVWISHSRNLLKLAVEDEGTGLPENIESEELLGTEGLGLFGMRERLMDIGGDMRIESERNKGTCVTLWVPFDKSDDAMPEGNKV